MVDDHVEIQLLPLANNSRIHQRSDRDFIPHHPKNSIGILRLVI